MPTLPATFKIPRNPDFPDVTFLRISPHVIAEKYEVTITPYDVMRWARLHDDNHPWEKGLSPWGGPVAMPWILYFSSMNLLGHEFGREAHLPPVNLPSGFARYKAEYYKPIPVGSTVTVGGEVTDKFSRRGRGYIEWRLDAWLDGDLVQRHWKTWSFPALPEELAPWPERPNSPVRPEEPALERFGPLSMEMHLDRLVEFEGPIPLNSHNDPSLVKDRPGNLVHGALSFGLICRLLRDRFGAGYIVGGTIDVRFIQPVYSGQTVTAWGEVLEEKDGVARCKVWAENNLGAIVTIGTATARANAER